VAELSAKEAQQLRGQRWPARPLSIAELLRAEDETGKPDNWRM
jgi:hypothetical protein